MTEQDKVTVDDIIGIVKTEEQTNSVEEVRKLRGRENKTAKRFKLGYVCGDYGLIDNDKWIDLHSMSENSEKNVQICINKMNELAEENEVCKEAYNEIKSDAIRLKNENEQLKIALNDKENLISICEKKFKELGYLITCDDDGYVIE